MQGGKGRGTSCVMEKNKDFIMNPSQQAVAEFFLFFFGHAVYPLAFPVYFKVVHKEFFFFFFLGGGAPGVSV